MGSKGSVLVGGPGGRAQAAQAILVFKSTFPASETHLDRNSEIHFLTPTPHVLISQQIYTDLRNDQIWSPRG